MSSAGSNSSWSSYYSANGLPDSDPARKVKASNIRDQVKQAPSKKPKGTKYPEGFSNFEKKPYKSPQVIRLTRSTIIIDDEYQPLKAQPIMPSGSYTKGPPGPLRAVYNDKDRTKFDVMYHNPKISSDKKKNYDNAPYREGSFGLRRLFK